MYNYINHQIFHEYVLLVLIFVHEKYQYELLLDHQYDPVVYDHVIYDQCELFL